MFTIISWKLYLTVIASGLAIWYSFVSLTYYRKELKLLFAGRFLNKLNYFNKSAAYEKANDSVEPVPGSSSTQTIQDGMNTLISSIQLIAQTANQKTFTKPEILLAIRLALTEYRALKQSPFFSAINNLIIIECTQNCAIELEQQDLNALWQE
jgi:hypothetical protein